MKNSTTLILNKVCPFAERVWITLEQKKVAYELKEVSLTNKQVFFTETYRKAFGHDPKSDGKVPILIDGDKIITQSDLVSWYIAQKYQTGNALIPDNAYDKLRLRWFVQTHGKFVDAFYGFIGFNSKTKEDQEKQINSLHIVLSGIDNSLTLPYALGKEFTLADIFICPWFERWGVIQTTFNIKIFYKYPKVKEWFDNVSQRDSIKVTRQPTEFYIEGYKTYFN